MALMVQAQPERFGGRVLHFAAEPALVPVFKRGAREYVTTDLEAEHVDVQADITDLPFEDGEWDTIVCSHVLEHVGDDAQAIRELRRVVAPGGTVVVMVPTRPGTVTDEDPSITDPAERIRRFGQADHVRFYGDDLADRLTAGGFTDLAAVDPGDFPIEAERCRLEPINAGAVNATYLCRR